ncbi:helix-turn-helix transcriptional regulator [bacterium]|nr:helix-turn-helix transcriptional regulator [bacterium]
MARYNYTKDTSLTLEYCYEQISRLIPNFEKQVFAKMINTTKQNLGQRMKKGSVLSVKELDILRENLQENNIPSRFLDSATLPLEDQFIQVPVRSEVELSCGSGSVANADFITDTIGFDVNFIRRLGGNPQKVSIVFARGDSMEDKISSGDHLIIDESKTNINDGMIYAFVYDSELYCKKIQKRPNELTAISLNKQYQPFPIEKDRTFNVVGQVIGVIKKII